MPPIHQPFFFEAAILSRMRSPATSRSNWAKDNRTLRVSRPIDVVVLNCCVTDTNETPRASKTSVILAKSLNERVRRSILLGDHHIDLALGEVGKEPLQGRAIQCAAGEAAVVIGLRQGDPDRVGLGGDK